MSIDDIIEAIGSLSVVELAELIEKFKGKFGVTIAAPVAAAPAAGGGGGGAAAGPGGEGRSEERRGGEEGRSRWAPYHLKKKRYLESGGCRRMLTCNRVMQWRWVGVYVA